MSHGSLQLQSFKMESFEPKKSPLLQDASLTATPPKKTALTAGVAKLFTFFIVIKSDRHVLPSRSVNNAGRELHVLKSMFNLNMHRFQHINLGSCVETGAC